MIQIGKELGPSIQTIIFWTLGQQLSFSDLSFRSSSYFFLEPLKLMDYNKSLF